MEVMAAVCKMLVITPITKLHPDVISTKRAVLSALATGVQPIGGAIRDIPSMSTVIVVKQFHRCWRHLELSKQFKPRLTSQSNPAHSGVEPVSALLINEDHS